jgi:hypothetical protein
MQRELVLIPTLKVHPTKLICYNEHHWTPAPPYREKTKNFQATLFDSSSVNVKDVLLPSDRFVKSSRQGFGILSKAAKKRLVTSIEYFLLLNSPTNCAVIPPGRKFNNRISFVTLTLPSAQVHTDNEIKAKCLNQFLIECSKYCKVSMYVWRAEYQKNGNIHFHVLMNNFIGWQNIMYRWNRIIEKLGYVTRYAENMVKFHIDGFKVRTDLLATWNYNAQLQAFKRGVKTNWRYPNSTDIHSLQKISNVTAYLTKYLTKNEQLKKSFEPQENLLKQGIGRTWGVSLIISNCTGAITQIDSELEEHLKNFEEHFPKSVYHAEYFSIYDINISMLEQISCFSLTDLFYDYLFKTFGFSRQFSF